VGALGKLPRCGSRMISAAPLISRGTESSQTRRWREMDSNFQYRDRRAGDFQRTQVDHPRIRTGFPGGHQAGLRRLATGVVGFGSGPRLFPTCGIGTKIGLLGRVPAYPALWSRQPVDRNGVTSSSPRRREPFQLQLHHLQEAAALHTR